MVRDEEGFAAMPGAASPPRGCMRRLIDLRAWDARSVTGWLEDDFHHFGLELRHDGRQVTDVRTAARRIPYTTCGGAAAPMRALVGKPLIGRAAGVADLLAMHIQCTHLYDLAGLLLAHAFHRRAHRRYEAIVEDRLLADRDAPRAAWLLRDGAEVLRWQLHGNDFIAAPGEAPRSIGAGFRVWTLGLPEDQAEYATVLRRTVFIAAGRGYAVTEAPPAEREGVCHTYQHDVRITSRATDDRRNYEAGSEDMLDAVATRP